MTKFRVDYKTNKGEMKGKTITVMIEGTDVDDVTKRFHRTSDVVSGGDVSYKAEIIMISTASESQTKRYASQGMPGA